MQLSVGKLETLTVMPLSFARVDASQISDKALLMEHVDQQSAIPITITSTMTLMG